MFERIGIRVGSFARFAIRAIQHGRGRFRFLGKFL